MTIANLKEQSVRIDRETIVCWPQYGTEMPIADMKAVRSHEGEYSVDNDTVCFVHEGEIFVTPWTRDVLQELTAAHFLPSFFHVPFSKGDYPKRERLKWSHLRRLAHNSYYRDCEASCIEYSKKHGIGALDDKVMQRCFKMPHNGVTVKNQNFTNVYYPVCDESKMNDAVTHKLGGYCTNNGKVVFVGHDGHTYVANGDWILEPLKQANYRKIGLFVPFSNGEKIVDPCFAAKWEALQ